MTTASTPAAARLRPRQFTLRWLFELMVVAAVLFALPAALWRVVLGVVLVVAMISLLLAWTLIPVFSFISLWNTHRLPRGVWLHLGGMLSVALSPLAFDVPLVGIAVLGGSALLLFVGPVLAVSECAPARLPEECHTAAWLTAMSATALVITLLGGAVYVANWMS